MFFMSLWKPLQEKTSSASVQKERYFHFSWKPLSIVAKTYFFNSFINTFFLE